MNWGYTGNRLLQTADPITMAAIDYESKQSQMEVFEGFRNMFLTIGGVLWFFTYHFTVLPVLVVTPLFLVPGLLMPVSMYRNLSRTTIVERLREAEA